MIADNISFLKRLYPKQYEKCKEVEAIIEESEFKLHTAKNGEISLSFRKTADIKIVSGYNPHYQAEIILQQYVNLEEYDFILFLGTGLGYHIELLLEKYPNKKIYIYEPITEIFYHYISTKTLPQKFIEKICIGTEELDMIDFISHALQKSNGHVLIIDIPTYKDVFAKEYNIFLKLFEKSMKDRRSSIHTNYSFEKRWIINSLINFKEVLTTPNILMVDQKQFQGKSAILVAAGPSLNEEIECLKYIKENKLAYIFSVGSAINTLVEKDILPDSICTYDPKEENQKVFKKINEKGITNIPMIFGSSVGFEVLQQYKGPKLHMLTNQDTISSYYLKGKDNNIETVSDAISIAVVTLEMLYKLGFTTVVLVGQNLGYREDKRYAEGIDYHHNHIDSEEYKNLIKVKDVYGNEIYTNDVFNRMRLQIETYIQQFKELKVINTTRGGASIQGTVFLHLDDVIKEYLSEESINEECIAKDKESFKYDKAYLEEKVLKVEKAYKQIGTLLVDMDKILSAIEVLKGNQNYKQIDKIYQKLDDNFNKLKKNDFARIFTMPMNRVYFEMLHQDIVLVGQEKNKIIKAEKALETFKKIINIFKATQVSLEDVFTRFQEMIKAFLKDEDISKINILESDTNGNSSIINQTNHSNSINILKNIVNDPNIHILYDIKALFSKQYNSDNEFNRMDTIVRYLAIDEYYGKNDYGFKLYEKMQKARGQKIHDIDRFKKLIRSIDENGFNEDSNILVDQSLQLIDGSHRLACALYFNVERIPIKIQPQIANIKYTIDWFKNAGFTNHELEIIKGKQKDILEEKGIYFVITLWPPIQKYFDEITEDLRQEHTILAVKDYIFENENEFRAVVKGQYAVDDIETWKIEKKLHYMEEYNKKIRIITLDIGNPQFRGKTKNNKPISTKVEKIKNRYRQRYSNKITNYFHDIIIHIGDNYKHSQHTMSLMQKNIEIVQFLKSISSYKYVLTKIDVPYTPKNFPFDYPLNKDMDIICTEEDFEKICRKICEFGDQYLDQYKVKTIKEDKKFRVRFELNDFLLYQIDVSCDIKGVKKYFIDNAIERRKKINFYYVLDKKDEIIIRILEYNKNPKKTHHYIYIIDNKEYLKSSNLKEIIEFNKINNEMVYFINMLTNNRSVLGEKFNDDGKSVITLDYQQQRIKKQVLNKIKNNIYKYQVVKCSLCEEDIFEILCEKERNGIYMPVSICKNCGLIQNNPRMDQNSLNEFYNLEFNSLFRNENTPEEYFNIQYERGKALYKYLSGEVLKISKNSGSLHVVEVGCGIGGILKYFKDAGCTIKGIDLGEEYITYGRGKYNLDLEVGDINTIKNGPLADIIIYRHVLEHIVDLKEELKSIKNILKPEGILYIEVPGVKNLYNSYEQDFIRYLMLSHMHHFSLKSLTNLLNTNGFDVIYGDEIIKCIAKKSNSSERESIDNDYYSAMKFLLELEKARK